MATILNKVADRLNASIGKFQSILTAAKSL